MRKTDNEHYIKVPAEMLDDPTLPPSEFRILLHIVRQTTGYGKKWDGISLSQFEKATGLSRHTVITALEKLQGKKMISVRRGGPGKFNSYAIGGRWKTPSKSSAKIAPLRGVGSAKSAHTILELQQIYDDRAHARVKGGDPAEKVVINAKEHFEEFIGFLMGERVKRSLLRPYEKIRDIEDIDRYKESVLRGLELRDPLTVDNAWRFFNAQNGMDEERKR